MQCVNRLTEGNLVLKRLEIHYLVYNAHLSQLPHTKAFVCLLALHREA
jgi:hypothetical protein